MIRYELYDKQGGFITEVLSEDDIDFNEVGYVDKVEYDEEDNISRVQTIYDYTDTETAHKEPEQFRYTYNGPVSKVFGEKMVYCGNIKVETIAKTDAKAISNIKCQIRQNMHLMPTIKLKIDTLKIKKVGV